MAALTTHRDTKQYSTEAVPSLFEYTMGSGATIYQGSIVVLDAGVAVAATTDTGLTCVGMAMKTLTNASGGTTKIPVRCGAFIWGNSGSSDLIALTEVGSDCYIVDDQTVAKTGAPSGNPSVNTRSRAGKILNVTTSGVTVLMGPMF